MIATGSNDGIVKIWNRQSQLLKTINHNASVYSVSFSPDSQTLASGGGDDKVKLWQLDGRAIVSLDGHLAGIGQVTFSPDGQMIATASDDKTVKLWHKDGTLIITLTGHTGEVNGISFSPDGKTLVSGSKDGTAILWNVENLTLNNLMGRGCYWLHDYLANNSQGQSVGDLCDGVKTQAKY
jgi:WD40 repeat protein